MDDRTGYKHIKRVKVLSKYIVKLEFAQKIPPPHKTHANSLHLLIEMKISTRIKTLGLKIWDISKTYLTIFSKNGGKRLHTRNSSFFEFLLVIELFSLINQPTKNP